MLALHDEEAESYAREYYEGDAMAVCSERVQLPPLPQWME